MAPERGLAASDGSANVCHYFSGFMLVNEPSWWEMASFNCCSGPNVGVYVWFGLSLLFGGFYWLYIQ